MAVPFVWAMRSVLQTAGSMLARGIFIRNSVIDAFFRADMAGAYPLVESLIASLFVAIAAVFLFLTARRFLAPPGAAAIALIFAFAASAWSTASRLCFNMGPQCC